MQKTFKLATLGCRTNQYESQGYKDQLLAIGYRQATDDEKADICIVNTCTVTESSDSSSRHAIRQLARENPDAKIAVTGCYAESSPDIISKIDGVSLVVSNKEKENLLTKLLPDETIPEFKINHFEAHTRAFVKVQDGCNSFCTYCVIPYVRGRSRSRNIDEIVSEVETLIKNGYKEVVITGINVGDYDGGGTLRLAELVRIIDKIPGLRRLRVSSIDPDEVDADLTDAILNGINTCPSMHIVLQSGSNVILKRMNRKYTRQVFLETVDCLRNLNPLFTFTTDVIVGFPGETETDFQETIEVLKEVQFAKIHMFPYSDRPKTRSSLMPGKISSQIIKERKQQVLHTAEEMAYILRNRFLHQNLTVLTEQVDGDFIYGHTENFLEVILPKGNLKSNEMVKVHLLENTPKGFLGEYISHA